MWFYLINGIKPSKLLFHTDTARFFDFLRDMTLTLKNEAKKPDYLHLIMNYCTFVPNIKQYGGLSLVNISWLREESPGNAEHHIS